MSIDWSKIEQQAEVPKEVWEGSNAFLFKIPQDKNPYAVGSKQHEDWAAGWEEAQYAEEYFRS